MVNASCVPDVKRQTRTNSLNMARRSLKILTIGPLPPPYFGTTVSFLHLADFLAQCPNVDVIVLNTVGIRSRGLFGLGRFAGLIVRIISAARKSDVITLHCSTTALHIMGPITLLAARLAGKRMVIRKFAGDDYTTALGAVGRKVAEFVLRRSDAYLLQTRALVNCAKARGIDDVIWYPTSRPVPQGLVSLTRKGESCTRFVYIGRVCEAKGMNILAKAAQQLPEGIVIDIYGPWAADLDRSAFDNCPNVKYRGEVEPDRIIPTFLEYDVSVLPTFYAREGYPGAIVESYIAGVPVIATRWLSIPEIVDDTVGILVAPNDADDLARAMTLMVEDKDLFQRLRANTKEKAQYFSTEHWGQFLVDLCRGLVNEAHIKHP